MCRMKRDSHFRPFVDSEFDIAGLSKRANESLSELAVFCKYLPHTPLSGHVSSIFRNGSIAMKTLEAVALTVRHGGDDPLRLST